MQSLTIPTGVHNPEGHSAAEILEALQGVNGSRKFTTRYELLTSANVKVSDLDNVLDCSIEQNWLADIKRTAKFTIKSDGTINYLSQRIKPWIQLHMPPTLVPESSENTTTVASGGTVVDGADGFRYHTFTSSGTLNVTVAGSAEYLVVAGGGGGGGGVNTSTGGAGGGAGGVLNDTITLSAGSYTITVGDGGIASTSGNDSSFNGSATATGGGRGAGPSGSAQDGGSGGGALPGDAIPGTGVAGQGNDGGGVGAGGTEAGAGGGGAGAVGGDTGPSARDPGDGGAGIEWPTGSGTFYGGGGGGSNGDGGGGGFVSAGGVGGGGGGHSGSGNGESGTANTGGGGGASRGGTPGSGGSGVVVIRYAIPVPTVTPARIMDGSFVEWPQGVFLLSTPKRQVNVDDVVTREVEGYDALQVFLDDKVENRYTVAAGTAYTDEVSTLLGSIPQNVTPSASTLTAAKEWEPGTPKLRIINDLLSSINYESLSFDEDGVAIARPYTTPADRGSEYTYADDSVSIMYPEVMQELDLFSIANKWILVVSDPDLATPLSSSYTNNDPASPTSTVSRQRTIVDFRTEMDAADQTALDNKVARLAFEASQIFEAIEFTTGMNPIHSGNDVYTIVYDPLAVNAKFSEHTWKMELRAGAPMTHRARRVVTV